MDRRALIFGILSAAFVGIPTDANARRKKRRGVAGGATSRDTTDDGKCPCNGGKVCVGKRGGRYCISSSGRKRYGV